MLPKEPPLKQGMECLQEFIILGLIQYKDDILPV